MMRFVGRLLSLLLIASRMGVARGGSCLRGLLACLVFLLVVALPPSQASATGVDPFARFIHSYDASAVSATSTADTGIDAFRGYNPPAAHSRPNTSSTGARQATKAPDEAAGGVYSLRDETGNVMRTGRSKDLARRRGEHARDSDLSRYEFRPEFRTDDYGTQRGLEQLLHEQLIPPLNKINPISPRNPRRGGYIRSAEDFLGGGR